MTTRERVATMNDDELVALLETHDELSAENVELRRQLEWFKRQLFGEKSERRIMDPQGQQLALGEEPLPTAPTPTEAVAAYRRRSSRSDAGDAAPLRFDETVPVEVIRVPPPAGVTPQTHEKISEKTTDRIAQRPGSYVVLRYVREVWKMKNDGSLVQAPAPPAVLEKSLADVSLLAGLLIDKFLYHLPLYRQHQRMAAAGIHITRTTLTNWVHGAADLLVPIYDAQLASVLSSKVIAMDETPIRAGRSAPGKMKKGYFWPIFGDKAEIVFPFSTSRSSALVKELLDSFGGTLITDGYEVYDRHAAATPGLTHANCWSHVRRKFEESLASEPALCGEALHWIGKLYEVEAAIQQRGDPPEKRQIERAERSKPIVEQFFLWLDRTVEAQLLLPTNPFLKAANYAMEREAKLKVFLENPAVPIDTNHLERQIRPIAVGRKNWLFCWTEVGAQYVGVVNSLIATCRLHGIAPYEYFVDVLQRVETHPAIRVKELTPRLWKEHFAANPMRSDLDRLRRQ
jgi:transposase